MPWRGVSCGLSTRKCDAMARASLNKSAKDVTSLHNFDAEIKPLRACRRTRKKYTVLTSWQRGEAMERKELLQRVSFGTQVAEDERRDLARYFVETDQWRRIVNGEIDVIRGEKGAGKSAIYALLIENEADFFDKRTIIIAGENPRGDTVFRDIATEPPASEAEFIILWKLYIIALIAREMRSYDIKGKEISHLYRILEDERLIEEERNLASILRNVQRTAKRILQSINLDTAISTDQATGYPVVGAKISLKEPTPDEKKNGFLSIDNMFSVMSKCLLDNDWEIWILLDRLDVAFIDNHDLEANALRALMRVLQRHQRV